MIRRDGTHGSGDPDAAPKAIVEPVEVTGAPDFLELRHLVHDLRQPIAAIRAAVAELRLRGAAARDRLDLIDDQIGLMDDLIRTLAQRQGRIGPVELATVTRRALDTVRPLYARVALREAIEPAASATIDELTWWRIVQILTDNALRSVDPHGTVEVALRTRDGRVELQVDDDGIGGFGATAAGEMLGLRYAIREVHARGGGLTVAARPGGGCSVLAFIPRGL
jgi:glucose-6-phosphate-specific signal transduction histidine kinase